MSRMRTGVLLLSLVLSSLALVHLAIAEGISPSLDDSIDNATYPGTVPGGCRITEATIEIEKWLSYAFILSDEDMGLSLWCVLGSRIYHPILRMNLTLECDTPPLKRPIQWRFHGGGEDGRAIRPLANEPRPNKQILPVKVEGFPRDILPAEIEKFLQWYHQVNQNGGFGTYCANPGANDYTSCQKLNCGGYFLLLLAKLLNMPPSEIAQTLEGRLGDPCYFFAWQLAGPTCPYDPPPAP